MPTETSQTTSTVSNESITISSKSEITMPAETSVTLPAETSAVDQFVPLNETSETATMTSLPNTASEFT